MPRSLVDRGVPSRKMRGDLANGEDAYDARRRQRQ
jgi:hypothetical protein